MYKSGRQIALRPGPRCICTSNPRSHTVQNRLPLPVSAIRRRERKLKLAAQGYINIQFAAADLEIARI